MAKRLRSGFTTGACAAAAAKAAAIALKDQQQVEHIEIPFPDGSRRIFPVSLCRTGDGYGHACIIKDAGDDPDVTNGAEICATAVPGRAENEPVDCVRDGNIWLCRGQGVGTVTKPGLAISAGEPAINPVPRQMILAAVREAVHDMALTVTISIPAGEILAEKTLNKRLGIIGGLSILGTTGIVRPVSADAWTATIKASLDVARQAHLREVVLSTGRTSEKGAQQLLNLPEEAYAMMGDYLEFSLKEAGLRQFTTIHVAAMWAKLIKGALRIPQTHVRNGALETADAASLLADLGCRDTLLDRLQKANTAREMLTILETDNRYDIVKAVCTRAKMYCQEVAGTNVQIYLINHKAETVCHV